MRKYLFLDSIKTVVSGEVIDEMRFALRNNQKANSDSSRGVSCLMRFFNGSQINEQRRMGFPKTKDSLTTLSCKALRNNLVVIIL